MMCPGKCEGKCTRTQRTRAKVKFNCGRDSAVASSTSWHCRNTPRLQSLPELFLTASFLSTPHLSSSSQPQSSPALASGVIVAFTSWNAGRCNTLEGALIGARYRYVFLNTHTTSDTTSMPYRVCEPIEFARWSATPPTIADRVKQRVLQHQHNILKMEQKIASMKPNKR